MERMFEHGSDASKAFVQTVLEITQVSQADCSAWILFGSISSLRCQKSRMQHPGEDTACEVMFRGRERSSSFPQTSGGGRRDRTDDLMLAKHALSQLSYAPVPEDECSTLITKGVTLNELVGLGRLELPTSRLSSARSNQLSYKPQRREAWPARRRTCNVHRSTPPLARVRPRRKRNEDGGVPPMQLNNPDDRWPLMFQKRFDSRKLQVASF